MHKLCDEILTELENEGKIHRSNFKFPEPMELTLRLKDVLESEVDKKYYLSNVQIEKLKMKSNDSLIYDKSMLGFESNAREYNDLMPTITSREWKEPRVVNETKLNEINMIGLLNIKGNEQVRRVYGTDGISPTLNTMQGGNRQPKILTEHKVNPRIRKLTPLECWRLMGFSDDDFNKVKSLGISDTQLYKMSGNSIVVNVLVEIYKELFKEDI